LKVDIEQPADWARKLRITVPAARVQKERNQIASQFAKRIRMPGFRKGKVPASVVEKQYGPSIDSQTLERVINSAYQEALRDQKLSPISQASVENVDYEPGEDLSFDVEFEVRPEIDLERLGGFAVKAPSVSVADADVDKVLTRLREQNARWTPVESGTPDEGDRVKVEITPLREGEDEPEPREYEVVLGAGEILDDIDQAIRTLEPGDEGEFTVKLPEPAEGEEEHRIRLKLLGAEHPELPEADDEFASELGPFETLEALRERIREDLTEESQRESDREVRRQLIHQVVEANPFEVPPSLVDQYLDGLIQAPDDADPSEVASAKEQARPAAEHAVRRMLVIDRVAEQENLNATQADLDQRVDEIAEQNEMQPAEVRRQLSQSGRLQALASDLTEQRVFDYLKSLSTIEPESE
jgi:trigger factor